MFTALAPRLLPAYDLAVHRLTGGRLLPSSLLIDTVILITTGHRTGQQRATPLCAHHGGDGSWLVVASNFGQPHHPAWSTNLLHTPTARLTHQNRTITVTARQLTEEDKTLLRNRILTTVPIYDTYAARARPHRDIRVFHLAPHP
ncbi:nitroreductase/quinone reductase family protein [Streptomyces atroolivaceus]|uniref:nitroreductase/quinone reductase family protein n=1 Tax=Streptomyces atroolivaceus TaxID=66869 RepID=UPI00363C4902